MLDKIKGKHILVDGDIYAYRCAASAEKTKYLVEISDDFWHFDSHKEAIGHTQQLMFSGQTAYIWSRKEVQPLEFALQACKTAIDSLLAKLSPSKVSIFLSPDRTFRHSIAITRPYKGNRVQPKPKYLEEVKKYLIDNYKAEVANNVEADDEIGRYLSEDGDGRVCVSIDKDLLQIPGWHYNWVNDTVRRVAPKEADFSFYTQLLTGDATDNIPGIAGIGPLGAGEILRGARSSKELCSRVWGVYRDKFDDPDKAVAYFNEQAGLLYILRGKNGFTPPIELKGA